MLHDDVIRIIFRGDASHPEADALGELQFLCGDYICTGDGDVLVRLPRFGDVLLGVKRVHSVKNMGRGWVQGHYTPILFENQAKCRKKAKIYPGVGEIIDLSGG